MQQVRILGRLKRLLLSRGGGLYGALLLSMCRYCVLGQGGGFIHGQDRGIDCVSRLILARAAAGGLVVSNLTW